MIKHLKTPYALVLFYKGKTLQISKDFINFNAICDILNNENVDDEEVMKFLSRLEWTEDDFTLSDNEIYFEGKYYYLNDKMYSMLKSLIDMSDGDIRPLEVVVKFLKKLLANKNLTFDVLQETLIKLDFAFFPDGDIALYKEDEHEKMGVLFEKERPITNTNWKYDGEVVIKTDPEFITSDFKTYTYSVVDKIQKHRFNILNNNILSLKNTNYNDIVGSFLEWLDKLTELRGDIGKKDTTYDFDTFCDDFRKYYDYGEHPGTEAQVLNILNYSFKNEARNYKTIIYFLLRNGINV